MDYGEQVSRKALAELPKGRFELAEEQDDGAIHKVTIDITNHSAGGLTDLCFQLAAQINKHSTGTN